MARDKGKPKEKVKKPPTKKAKTSGSKMSLVGKEVVEVQTNTEDYREPVKRRTPTQVIADKDSGWKANMATRGFKNERQVDISKLGKIEYGICHIYKNGLDFWTEPLAGYNKNVVIEFYQNMRPMIDMKNPANNSIESKVGRFKITITPDEIAKNLNYVRPAPDNFNYPIFEGDDPIDPEDVHRALYKDASDYKGGDHIPGKFKEDCRLINIAIHANLYPRGLSTKPTAKGAELIYVFMSDGYAFDAAEWIFHQLLDFKFNIPSTAQMPFPCLITSICKKAGVTGPSYAYLEELRPGVIDKTTLNRSKSKSKAPLTPGTSKKVDELLTPPDGKAKQEAWNKKIFDQMTWVITELLSNRKEIGEIKRQMEWQTRVIEACTEHRYEAPMDENVGDGNVEMDEEAIDPSLSHAEK